MEGKMNALLKTAPEPDAMQYVEDFPIPQIKEDEVLLEIKAAGICGTDHSLYRWNEAIANSYNIQWPAIFCHEFSGVIAEVGPKAPQNLKPGMHVTANPILYDDTCEWCDRGMVNICDNRPFYGTDLPGAFAKYMAIRGINVIPMPEEIPFTQAALMEPLCVAMNAVERLDPQIGDTCVVMGPGAIGLLMVSLLIQARGIRKVIVTGLDADKKRFAVAEKLGAICVNGSECNVVEKVKELTDGKGPNCIFDAAGHFTVVQQAVEMVAKNGKIGITGLPARASELHMTPIAMRQISIIGSRAYTRKNWKQALNLLANGFDISLISNMVVPMSEWRKGMEFIESGEGLRVVLEP
ncbi:MAG: alcohol dehydrogenase catalytic domain-containing protein [Coriobacteriia bacterium]|nr:alcohol dehydrogenase catalytic domain-containing protein [Coriobacteriia bacterium]